jgi:hypothetical protein
MREIVDIITGENTYRIKPPENPTFPFCVVKNTRTEYHIDGSSQLTKEEWQVDVCAKNYDDARVIAVNLGCDAYRENEALPSTTLLTYNDSKVKRIKIIGHSEEAVYYPAGTDQVIIIIHVQVEDEKYNHDG